jgi:acetyl-CoA carboxylase carboxyl transferase subunit alpha
MEYLPFEKPIAVLAARATAAREAGDPAEAAMFDERARRQLVDLYSRLTPWQRTQVARHPDRPHFRHLVEGLFEEFLPLGGDRAFGDDQAILGGFARLAGRRVVVIGHAKGEDTRSRLHHNFGMGRPEGYRKAIRLMDLADRFELPVITLVDTPGASPGSMPKRGAKARRSRAAPSVACHSACRPLRSSLAKAAPAARSRSPRPTAC